MNRRTAATMRLAFAPMLVAPLLASCMASAPGDTAASGNSSGSRLRVALTFPPVAQLSPYSDDAYSLTRLGIAETLVTFDANGTPQPGLATSAEMTSERTATLKLPSGVTFHDGTAVNAESVAASLKHALSATPKPDAVSGADLTVAAQGNDVVTVTSAKADPILLQRLADPQLVILAPAAYQANASQPSPVQAGTGPFILRSVNGSTGASADANPSYRGGAPKLAGLDIRFISEASTRVSALRAGELDVAQNVPISQLGNLSDQTVLRLDAPRTIGLSLNTRSEVFKDAGLRAAAARAIKPDAIASSVFEGNANAATGYFRENLSWTKDAPAPSLPAATSPAGKTIKLATYDDRAELPESITLIADQLRAAGFTVPAPVVKPYALLEKDIKAGTYDAVLGSRLYAAKANDPVAVLQADFGCKGTANLTFLCNQAVDSVLARGAAQVDVAARRAAAVEAQTAILSTGAYIPVVHEQVRIGHAKSVSGLAEDPLEQTLVTAGTTLGK